MKYLSLLILPLFLLTMTAFGQSATEPSGLTILQKKWRETPNLLQASPQDTDPFQTINESAQIIKDRRDNLRDNILREKQQQPLQGQIVRVRRADANVPVEFSKSYTYQIKVRNNLAKTIKNVVWEYVFFDAETKQEVGRHTFSSDTQLDSGEVDKLVVKILSPPTRVANVKNAGKKLSKLYTEQVNIKSVQFTDGSVWQENSK